MHEVSEFLAELVAPLIMGGMLVCLPLFLSKIKENHD